MILHRPLDPATAAGVTPGNDPSPFTISWAKAMALLDREASHLAGTPMYHVNVYVEVDLPPSAIRQDGGIRADATRRIASPVVAVEVPTADGPPLRMVSARYSDGYGSRYLSGWQANVYAVAKTLEALRAVNRWGAANGEQYRGFAAIGATSSGTALGAGLTPEDARRILAKAAGVATDMPSTPDHVASLYRRAAVKHHPDRGGDPALFARITEARDLLLRRLA